MANQLAPKPTDGYTQLVKLVGQDDVRARFEQALGKNSGAFLASLVNTVGTTPALRECTSESILRAAMTAAVLNLPVDKNIGHAWIIPYRDHGQRVAQFQMGYKGFVQLCLRTGQYTHLNAANIYEGMGVEEDVLTGSLKVVGTKISERVIGYAAYLRLKNGFEKAVYWTYDRVHEHARRYSKSYNNQDTPWKTHPDDMGKKTVLMQLVRRWGIMSVQVQDAIGLEERQAPKAHDLADYIDGEAHDPQPPAEPTLIAADSDTVAFDPVKALVDSGICKNEFAARGLLERVPGDFLATKEKLVAWGALYRSWREAGAPVDAALENASQGIPLDEVTE